MSLRAPLWGGADEHRMWDEEAGVILRLCARLRGEEFDVIEVRALVLDGELPEDTFRLQLPGEHDVQEG